jgi:hypothetical protein
MNLSELKAALNAADCVYGRVSVLEDGGTTQFRLSKEEVEAEVGEWEEYNKFNEVDEIEFEVTAEYDTASRTLYLGQEE